MSGVREVVEGFDAARAGPVHARRSDCTLLVAILQVEDGKVSGEWEGGAGIEMNA